MVIHTQLARSPETIVTQDDTDGELARRAASDAAAFAELYSRHCGRVYLYMLRRFGNAGDAADGTQQAFLKALASIRTFDATRGPFAGWLFAIARNLANTQITRSRRAVHWNVPEPTSIADGSEAAAIRDEEIGRLRARLSLLSTRDQEAIMLRFEAGLRVPEIATALGMKPEAAKKLLQRALKKLKDMYDADID